MTQPPTSVVVRVAATHAQAQVWVAMLKAEGIPAYVEGDSLADEVAMSRRVMNLQGTRVHVPSTSLDRAKQVLEAVQVDEAELAAQALAAGGGERPAPRRRSDEPTQPAARWPFAVAVGAAVVFLGLWLSEIEAKAASRNPLTRMEPTPTGWLEIRRGDGATINEYVDREPNGHFETVRRVHAGRTTTEAKDNDVNGTYESVGEWRADGFVCKWIDRDDDGTMDEGQVFDAQGKQVQAVRWIAGRGYEVTEMR